MAETLIIQDPAGSLVNDIIEETDLDIVERGGKGSGFHGHVGREGEVGGSAPEGAVGPLASGKKRAGRPPLPTGADADKPWKRNLMKEPTAKTLPSAPEIAQSLILLKEINDTLSVDDSKAEALMLWHNQKVGAGFMKGQNLQSVVDEAEKYPADQQLERGDNEIVPAMHDLWNYYWMTKFNLDAYDLGDQLSDSERTKLDQVGEMIANSGYYPGNRSVNQSLKDKYIEFDSPEALSENERSIWSNYEAVLPASVLENPYALQQAQAVVTDLIRLRNPAEELAPFYGDPDKNWGEKDEETSFFSVREYFQPLVTSKIIHPEVLGAVGDAWAERAMTEGTPEYAEAIALGGVDPQDRRFWIEGVRGMFSDRQWTPNDVPEDQRDLAEAINVGWVQNSSQLPSILTMNAAARVFGPVFGIEEIEPSILNRAVGNDSLSTKVTLSRDDEEGTLMTGPELQSWLDDPARRTQAEKIIDTMYENTQRYYQEKGFNSEDTVPLYRGLRNAKDTDWNPSGDYSDSPNDAEVRMWPISSWTLNEDEARSFAGGVTGAIVRAEIPINRILANAQTGFPCNHEQELIVLGGRGLRGTIYSRYDDPKAVVQGLVPEIWTKDVKLDEALAGLAKDVPAVTMRAVSAGMAVSMGGAFSLPSEMMTPELMGLNMSPGRIIYVDEGGNSNWLTDGLAAEGLDRFKVDGITKPEEGDFGLEKFGRKRRASRAKASQGKKKLVQRGGKGSGFTSEAGHVGIPEKQGGSQKGTAHSGEKIGSDGAAGPAEGSAFRFSRELPDSDRIIEWLRARHIPLDLLEVIANGTKERELSEEDQKRWFSTKTAEFDEAMAELDGVDLKGFNKENFVRPPEIHDIMEKIDAMGKEAEASGDEDAETYYREIWMALYRSGRTREEVFDFTVRKAVANGELSVEDATAIDSYDFGRFEGSREWKPLPQTLYHTTVAGTAVRETGLKSRWELQGEGMGLGGGNDATISYTDDPEWARDIERTVQEIQQVSAGEVTAADLMKNAAQGIGNNGKPFLTDLMSFSGMMGNAAFKGSGDDIDASSGMEEYLNSPDFDPSVPVPDGLASDSETMRVQRYIDAYANPIAIKEDLARRELSNRYEWLSMSEEAKASALEAVNPQMVEDRQRELAFDLFKGPYAYSREHAGGHRNPVIWGGSWQDFASIDPAEIITFEFKSKPGAMGGQMSALGEWRSFGSENVDVVDELNQFDPEDLWTEKSFLQKVAGLIKRGGQGSGFHGHVGREGELGGSAPEGTPTPGGYTSNKPGIEAYGSGVFTPMLKDIIYGWKDAKGWGAAQAIFKNVTRAQANKDDSYHGLAIGQDGVLKAIGALDYDAPLPEGLEGDYLKVDGLYTNDPAFSEELMVQMAIEAAKHNQGLWMTLGPDANAFAMQMGMEAGDGYAYWTADDVAQVAETLTSLEPTDYFAPPDKPRVLVSFDDAFEETLPEKPTDGRPAPKPISEMTPAERYQWENFNYSAWANPESWDPKKHGKKSLGYDPEDPEDEPSTTYEARVLEDLQNVHDGWADGTDSPWSVRFSEAVASVFGGTAIPESRPRDQHKSAQDFLEVLASDYGSDVVIPDDVDWYSLDEDEKWDILDTFNDFAQGAREEDIAADLGALAEDIYHNTQAKFKEAGYNEGDTVRLYRGLQSTPDEKMEGHDGGWIMTQPWSISSWTSAKSVAGDFATMNVEYTDPQGSGTLLTADIPVERILSMWQTGPGSHGEFEYLLLGQNGMDAYATRVDAKRRLKDVTEGKGAEEGIDIYDEKTAGDIGPELE